MSAEFVANMEDVLDLYAEPYDSQRPVVCFDETSTQLLAETRPSLPPRPGLPLRQDYEYRREGTRNLFLACEPLTGWRQVAVTQRRTMQDFAHQMRWLVDEAYPETPVVRVVMDNLPLALASLMPSQLCAGLRTLQSSTGGAGGHGQPEHSSSGVPVRDVPGGRGPADCQAAGVPLYPQAWKLVEPRIKYGAGYGRD